MGRRKPVVEPIEPVKVGFLDPTKNYNYSELISTDYSSEYDCQRGSDCCDNDYCRCGRIVETSVSKVNTWGIASEIYPTNNIMLTYCIDRILVTNKLYEDHHWRFDIGGGYYGEELDGVYLDDIEKINRRLSFLYETESDSDKLKSVLVEEYGYLLDKIKDLEFSADIIERSKIKVPNIPYGLKVDATIYRKDVWVAPPPKLSKNGKMVAQQKVLKTVFSYPGPVCVVREDAEGNLFLIDGYHRYSASAEESEVTVVVGRLGKP